jgi:hypothetical protein
MPSFREYQDTHGRSPFAQWFNLIDRVLEVHREAARPGPARRHWGYVAIATLAGDATITPLAAPSSGIRVADLLP